MCNWILRSPKDSISQCDLRSGPPTRHTHGLNCSFTGLGRQCLIGLGFGLRLVWPIGACTVAPVLTVCCWCQGGSLSLKRSLDALYLLAIPRFSDIVVFLLLYMLGEYHPGGMDLGYMHIRTLTMQQGLGWPSCFSVKCISFLVLLRDCFGYPRTQESTYKWREESRKVGREVHKSGRDSVLSDRGHPGDVGLPTMIFFFFSLNAPLLLCMHFSCLVLLFGLKAKIYFLSVDLEVFPCEDLEAKFPISKVYFHFLFHSFDNAGFEPFGPE